MCSGVIVVNGFLFSNLIEAEEAKKTITNPNPKPNAPTPITSDPRNIEEVIKEVDYLFDVGQQGIVQCFLKLKESLQLNPEEPRLLWRMSRVSIELASDIRLDPSEKQRHWKRAFNCASQAVKFGENVPDAHKWYAISLSNMAIGKEHKIQVQFALEAKKHLERALELSPKDSSIYHLLGVWYFGFADRSNVDKQLKQLFSSTPLPKATFEEALKYFLECDKLQQPKPTLKRNAIMIGTTYFKMNDKVKAKEWLQKALLMPNKNIQDEIYHEQAATLFQSIPQ